MTTADWASGYLSELDYTHGYYRELSPSILKLACLSAGVLPPNLEKCTYLELGYGQGLSLNIHAAACPGVFWGTDFNPMHAVNARAISSAYSTDTVLLDDSFEEFAQRSDLPEFDVIALHGIWSWISDENRKCLIEIIRRRLKVGGVVYISYNCLPGWAPAIPLRHLMAIHSDLAGSEAGGLVSKIEGSIQFAQQVIDSGALYFKRNPAVAELLKSISGQNRRYVAHEYFNRDWTLMHFSEVAGWLARAKLSFVASAHLLDHVDALNLSAEGSKLLSGIQSPVLRESIRDYLINQRFRRDIFIKGARMLSPLEKAEALRQQAFVLTTPPADIPMKVVGSLGEATLQKKTYAPLIAALAAHNFAPKTLLDVAADPELQSMSMPQLLLSILALVGAGRALPARQHPDKAATTNSRALNRALCSRARNNADIHFLASPVTGTGIQVGQAEQLFLLALQQQCKTPEQQARFVWDQLTVQGRRVHKDGKALESAEENLAELKQQAELFADRLPLLKALGVHA